MSTTTVSFRSTTQDVDISHLRDLEAESRAATRRAAARAQADRRRIDSANRTIAEQDAAFRSAVARLDAASRRLPDFVLRAPAIPVLSSEIARDPAQLEAYVGHMRSTVEQFARHLDGAILQAERLLKRRIAKAAAWRMAGDLEQQVVLRSQSCRDLAARLDEDHTVPNALEKPSGDADLEPIEAYVTALRYRLDERERQHARLRARLASRKRAAALGGTSVQMESADDALSRYEAERKRVARSGLEVYRDALLAEAGLCMGDLPSAVCAMVEDALAQAHVHDQRERLSHWIGRERQHRAGVERALALLQCAPELVHEDRKLSERWSNLTAHLQRVAGGLDDFEPRIEREYEQLCADARRLLNGAFTRADWVRAMRAQEFEVCEREDGQGLIVVDLDHPEIWLEATELDSEQGGFAVTLELKTDAPSPVDEAKVTDGVCARLARAAGRATDHVSAEAEVIERKTRITRSRRPATAQQTFARMK